MDENQYLMCPACGSKEIEAQGTVAVKLFSDGGTIQVQQEGKVSWDGGSEAHCVECSWHGEVQDTIYTDAPTGCLTVNKGKKV